VAAADYEKHVEERRVQVTFPARVPQGAIAELLETLETQPGIRPVRVEPFT
jgi:hypothetical protein